MGRHVCSEGFLLKFIRRYPGFTNKQLSERLGRDMSALLRKLMVRGLIRREKGFDPLTMRQAYKYYSRSSLYKKREKDIV